MGSEAPPPPGQAAPTLLVLHGVTMSGASMLRRMGPLREALEAEGFELVAPDAAVSMTPEAARRVAGWAGERAAARGQDAGALFREGVFWEGGRHHNWLDSVTDPATGRTRARGLLPGLDAIAAALTGREPVGVLGFSQGCAMAAVVAALARRGGLPGLAGLRFGVFLSGFLPRFDEPALDLWPVPGLAAWCGVGDEDALFPERETLDALAEALGARGRRLPGLAHDLPRDPDTIEEIVRFCRLNRPRGPGGSPARPR